MSSKRSFTSTESDATFDHFLKLFNESLVENYYNHMMPNFVSDIMKSINPVENGYSFFDIDNENDNDNDFFRKSPLLFGSDTDTQDVPCPENVHNSIHSEEQQNNVNVERLSVYDGEDQKNSEPNRESICHENASKDFQMVGINLKSKHQNKSVVHDECLMTSVSSCIASETTYREAFETWKSNNQQTQCNTTRYTNKDVSSIISIDTCIADNSTFCDAYENWISSKRQEQSADRTLKSRNVQPSSSISTGFQGFLPVASRAFKRPYMECSLGIANYIGDDDKTTYCEISEKWISTQSATETEQINFNLEEAYARCFLENHTEDLSSDRRKKLLEEIEKLTLKVLNDVKNGRKLKITVPNKLSWSNCMLENERLKPLQFGVSYIIHSKRKLAMIMFVLSFIYKLLLNNITCTKREIYYRAPEFTQNQMSVDIAIRDICIILNTRPWELGILSSSKGLIAGSIKITLHDDQVIDINSINGGILLPHSTTSIKKVETSADFVLLVEKDTIYERLLNENVLKRLGKSCILITGKGYPDINTRVILKRIWDDCKCPIYALVDADPYGIEIMLIYRYGSLSMSYNSDELAVPAIRWIGVYPSEIKSLGLPYIPLTGEDERRINDIMKRPYISKKVYEELLVLKTTKQKTELEALTIDSHDLIDAYLLEKIESGITI